MPNIPLKIEVIINEYKTDFIVKSGIAYSHISGEEGIESSVAVHVQ